VARSARAIAVLALGLAVAAIATTGRRLRVTPDANLDATHVDRAAAEGTTKAPSVDGAALGREGFARMQAGDYAAALPLLRQAVVALRGSNTLDEATRATTSRSRGSPSGAATA
jgi:hypothetical protein